MFISVIVPVCNGARTLADCLRAILTSDFADYEVIVVNDASTDNSLEIVRRFPCRVISFEKNQGAARAKNEGANAAQGDNIFFTDADILIQPNTLSIVAEDLADPKLAAVVGLLSQHVRYSNFSSQYKNLWMHYTYRRQPRYVGLFYTSVASIRRNLFLAAGGFDERYRGASVTEDIEFGQRVLTTGCKVLLDQRLTVEHVKHYGFWELLRTDVVRARGLFMTFLRNRVGRTRHKHWASVPWYFTLSVPLSGLLALCLLICALTGQLLWLAGALVLFLLVLLLSTAFLTFLGRARGWGFFLASCLFLPLDLFASGLGMARGLYDYVRGLRY